ncbi:helix-turn-helix domain-containing protein [Streptomyces longwoodensis]|nr:helix-turn-helix domain-containing protein [Streptomyces lasalocidi]
MDFEIRENRRKAVGRRALVRERAAYFRLMDQGFNNAEACRIVGINRRTGMRWLHEVAGEAPAFRATSMTLTSR